MIRQLNEKDYTAWLELAAEVESLFGPMIQDKEFQEGIKACIKAGDSYCKLNDEGIVAGIIAIDRIHNEISWLAVGKQHRGEGYGDCLIKKAIEELIINGDVYVQTFSAEYETGKPARKLYLNNGFVDYKKAGKNPAGLETVIMVKKA